MAPHNHERRAALDKTRKATEPARRERVRKRKERETQVASMEQKIPKINTKMKRAANAHQRKEPEVAPGPQTIQENAGKRKRAAQMDQSPRKKVQVENDDAAARLRRKYREPEGARKSRRIAGRSAESSESLPAGQNVQVSDTVEQASDVNPTTVIDTAITENTNTADEPSERTTEVIEQRSQGAQKVFAENVGTHRIVRSMTKEYTTWAERIHVLKHGRGGLLELERQFRHMNHDMEVSEEEMEAVRSQHAKRLEQISEAQAYLDSLVVPLRYMSATHAERNNRIYEFVGIRENYAELSFLPPKFWIAYKNCSTAYTACKDIESEIHAIKNGNLDVLRQLDERMVASVFRSDHAPSRESDAVQNAPSGELPEIHYERIRKLVSASQKLSRLHENLESARDKQYEEESRLNQIAEEAFVAAGNLRAVDNPEKIKLCRRVPSEIGKRNSGQRSESAGPIEQGQRSSFRGPDKSALADRVRRARRNVRHHQEMLRDARWQPLSNAGSMDSDAQGELRVRRWIKRTGELREAENEYRSARHRAQNEHAMNDSDQSSNFRDNISDGYGANTLKAHGYPMAEKKRHRIQSWMSPSSRRRRKQQVRQSSGASDKEGTWLDHVGSMEFGEEIEGRIDDRWKERIDTWEKERSRLREEGPFENAENDFHPRNSGTAADMEVNQQEDDVPMDIGGDDNEYIRQSPDNPRVLYNPDALTVDLLDSDRQAARWIDEHFNRNGGSGQALLYDPGAPLIDYAIDGYDGENMDGIE
ncbi:hypothetical protein MBLNU13_g00912t1 [Cladosporium sp. NU13]